MGAGRFKQSPRNYSVSTTGSPGRGWRGPHTALAPQRRVRASTTHTDGREQRALKCIRKYPVLAFVETSSGYGSGLVARKCFDGGSVLAFGRDAAQTGVRSRPVEFISTYLTASCRRSCGVSSHVTSQLSKRTHLRASGKKANHVAHVGQRFGTHGASRLYSSMQLARGVKAPSLFCFDPSTLQRAGHSLFKSFHQFVAPRSIQLGDAFHVFSFTKKVSRQNYV